MLRINYCIQYRRNKIEQHSASLVVGSRPVLQWPMPMEGASVKVETQQYKCMQLSCSGYAVDAEAAGE